MVHRINKTSYTVSLLIHAVIFTAAILLSIKTKPEIKKQEIEVEIGAGGNWGNGLGMIGTPDGTGKENITTKTEFDKNAGDDKVVNKNEKSITNTKTSNSDDNEVISNKNSKSSSGNANNVAAKLGDHEERAKGNGGLGYDIQWGGRGKRKIYRYYIPSYPEGVQVEANVKLRFTILQDGSVTRITPLVKSNPKLENVAITALTRWRFEPLDEDKEQTVTITFPFRLR